MRKLITIQEGFTTLCEKKKKVGLLISARGAASLFLFACTWLCGIQLLVVSIYACMCRCSPYSKDRCASRPSGHQSGRESGSSPGHTCECGTGRLCIFRLRPVDARGWQEQKMNSEHIKLPSKQQSPSTRM